MTTLHGIQLSSTIQFEQDMIDVPDTLHVIVKDGSKSIKITFTDDLDIISNNIKKQSDVVINSEDINSKNPYVKQIQQAIASYSQQQELSEKIISSLSLFPVLSQYVQTQKKRLINTLGFDELEPRVSQYIEKIDTHIAQAKTLEAEHTRSYEKYIAAKNVYHKKNTEYLALQKLSNKQIDAPNQYWVNLHAQYQANLKDLQDIEKAEKEIATHVNKLKKEIDIIQYDQNFLYNFDTKYAEIKNEKGKRKLLFKKESIQIKYGGNFDDRLNSAYAGLDHYKKESLYRNEMRATILEAQEDCLTQLVILHEPAATLQQDILTNTKKVEEARIELKEAQRITGRAKRKFESLDHMDKILALLTEEKRLTESYPDAIGERFVKNIQAIVDKMGTISGSSHIDGLYIQDRYQKYLIILADLQKQSKSHTDKNAGIKYIYPLTQQQHNVLYESIEKDFIYMQHRKPSLYLAHKQIYTSNKEIASLRIHIQGIDKKFTGRDKDSDAHKLATQTFKEDIISHERISAAAIQKRKNIVTEAQSTYQLALKNEKQTQNIVDDHQHLIVRLRKRITDMLAGPAPVQATDSHRDIDITTLVKTIESHRSNMEEAESYNQKAIHELYTHIMNIDDSILKPLEENYVDQLLETIESFRAKPKRSTPQEMRISPEEKVLLQRSYRIMATIYTRLQQLLIHVKHARDTKSDLKNSVALQELHKKIKALVQKTQSYASEK